MRNKLQDICLCAIVKNEKINAAGGILDYVESVVPYVGSAVIVDTGSTDGTRELLDKCSDKHSNLKIFDREFKGFSDARNYSIEEGKKAKRNYVLFLDADERLTKEDFEKLDYEMNTRVEDGYEFRFRHISFESGEWSSVPSWGDRLLSFSKNPRFYREVFEGISETCSIDTVETNIRIKHFLSSKEWLIKKEAWYSSFNGSSRVLDYPEGFEEHKLVSPHRNLVLSGA